MRASLLLLPRFFAVALIASGGLNAQKISAPVGEELQPKQRRDLSTNQAQKIIVKGRNNQMRMAIASISSDMARRLNDILNEQKSYQGTRNLYIEMYEKGTSKSNLQVLPRVTPFEQSDLVIELLVDTRSKVDRSVLVHGIIEILLYRKGLEDFSTFTEGQEAQVPAWLSYGMIGALEWKKDSSKRRVYEHLLSHPEMLPIDKVLSATGREVRGFDATNSSFYKAASTAFVLSLLRQEGGEESMVKFLNEVVLFEGEIEILLRKHFSSLSVGANALQKVWSLQVAEMAAPKLLETLTLAETDQRLGDLLSLNIADAEGNSQLIPLTEYSVLDGLSRQEKMRATDALRIGVVQLSNRAHPVYRPLLLEYMKLSAEMIEGDLSNIETRLPVLASERQQIVIADERCRDYLDWYQITRAHEVTGDFSGYMKMKERLAIEREERKDESIDIYLDKVQSVMGRD